MQLRNETHFCLALARDLRTASLLRARRCLYSSSGSLTAVERDAVLAWRERRAAADEVLALNSSSSLSSEKESSSESDTFARARFEGLELALGCVAGRRPRWRFEVGSDASTGCGWDKLQGANGPEPLADAPSIRANEAVA